MPCNATTHPHTQSRINPSNFLCPLSLALGGTREQARAWGSAGSGGSGLLLQRTKDERDWDASKLARVCTDVGARRWGKRKTKASEREECVRQQRDGDERDGREKKSVHAGSGDDDA